MENDILRMSINQLLMFLLTESGSWTTTVRPNLSCLEACRPSSPGQARAGQGRAPPGHRLPAYFPRTAVKAAEPRRAPLEAPNPATEGPGGEGGGVYSSPQTETHGHQSTTATEASGQTSGSGR